MISKKKLTALAVASLFVTPVMAAIEVDVNGIQGKDTGYIVADDTLFVQALEKSMGSKDHKNAVKLSMWGTCQDEKDGSMELNLKSKDGYQINYVLFGDNSTQGSPTHRSTLNMTGTSLELSRGIIFRNASNSIKRNPTHRSTLNMTGTSLELSRGIIFRNASNSIKRNSDGSYEESSLKELKNISTLNLDKSTLKGDVINQYATFEPTKDVDQSNYYYQISLTNNTHVSLEKSHWFGDLKDEIGLKSTTLGQPVNKDDVRGVYVVSLKNSSS